MKIREDESGQTLVLTAISITLLMGFLALAIDVGTLFRAKRNVQIAVDAGAVAGAIEEQYGGTPNPSCANGVSNVACAVYNAVAANGVPAADVVAVNTNPTDGYHTGTGYVEVIASEPNPTFFIGAFMGTKTSYNVAARAVAGMAPSSACMYVLDPSDADTFYIKGKGQVSAPGCGIQVNSSSNDATCNQGAAQIVSPFLHIVGKQDVGGRCKSTPNTQVVTGVAPSGDPFNDLTGPRPGNGCTGANTVSAATVNSTTVILSTNVTTGSTSAQVTCFSAPNVTLNGSGTNLNLGSAGGNQIFVFENGVQLSGTVNVNGTLDVYQGNFSQGNAQLAITAPADSSDTYNGIALMQPASNTTASTCDTSAPCLQIQFGSGNGNLTGLIYAPTSEIYMQDEGGGVQAAGVIAYQIYVNSQLSITESYNLANPSTSPLNKIELVE